MIHFESDGATKTAAGAMFVAVPCERPRFAPVISAPHLFCSRFMSVRLCLFTASFVNTLVADFVYAKRLEQRLCQLRFDTPIFESIRIISNVQLGCLQMCRDAVPNYRHFAEMATHSAK